jgi:hypothetical protein
MFPSASATAAQQQGDAFQTTLKYVSQFYPLWFTYNQAGISTPNQIGGPVRVSPLYHFVVAINDDTRYASSFLDFSMEPVILQIPSTSTNYSVLTLDGYCDVFHSAILANTPGTYALYGPGFDPSSLPTTVTPVPLPFNYMTIIFRADRFNNGIDMTVEADAFRRGLSTEPLCAYLGQRCPAGVPPGGPAVILPEIAFSIPFKTIADNLIALDPIAFLRQLQTAVASPRTPPMSPEVQQISDRFNALFAFFGSNRSEFAAGAQAAHDAIVNDYLNNTGKTNWITYNNIGDWGPHVVQRSSITEFIQYANDHSAAAYFHAFKDGLGSSLDGTDPRGYVLTFSAQEIPAAKRFWSVTAYTPEAIELVPNSANKYLVASYTPGLVTNEDGSISIYMAQQLPAGVPEANWLPIPSGPFNVMLRVYGPAGDVAAEKYVPPAIVKVQ